VRGEGAYFWDADGKRYLDWSSQLINVNVGHSHPHVIKAIQEQVTKMGHAYPAIATEPRARLGELLNEIAPGELSKSFFTVGGSDAIENAMKVARLYSGKQKVITRYRSYHGATFGARSAPPGQRARRALDRARPWPLSLSTPYLPRPYRRRGGRGCGRPDGTDDLV